MTNSIRNGAGAVTNRDDKSRSKCCRDLKAKRHFTLQAEMSDAEISMMKRMGWKGQGLIGLSMTEEKDEKDH